MALALYSSEAAFSCVPQGFSLFIIFSYFVHHFFIFIPYYNHKKVLYLSAASYPSNWLPPSLRNGNPGPGSLWQRFPHLTYPFFAFYYTVYA
jgi:hypothetical protein